jgi:hypothetical protein
MGRASGSRECAPVMNSTKPIAMYFGGLTLRLTHPACFKRKHPEMIVIVPELTRPTAMAHYVFAFIRPSDFRL